MTLAIDSNLVLDDLRRVAESHGLAWKADIDAHPVEGDPVTDPDGVRWATCLPGPAATLTFTVEIPTATDPA